MAGNATMTTSVDLSESQAPTIGTIVIIGITLAIIAVALRLYTRIVIVGKVFHNDYCILAALGAAVGLAICYGLSLLHGLGRHTAAITLQQRTTQFKVGVGGVFFFHLSHILIKSSILLQYVRICVLSLEKRICYIIMCIVIVEGFIWIIVLFLTCTPIRAMWEMNVPGAKCINATASFYGTAATLISADVAILVMPAFLLRHSSLPWLQKLMLGAVLALGGAATVASILRVRVIHLSTNTTDPAWDKAPNAILAIVEVDLGLICSCVVTLIPLFRRWHPAAWPKELRRSEAVEREGVPISDSGNSDSYYIEPEDTVGKTDVEMKTISRARLYLAQRGLIVADA